MYFLDQIFVSRNLYIRQQIADTLERVPIVYKILSRAYQLTQTRFTMGVVGVVLNSKNKILIVEHVFHPHYRWGLPGGWIEQGETPSETLKRELLEETGLSVTVSAPLLIEQGIHHNHFDVAYLCYTQNDVTKLSAELLDYRWVSPDSALLRSPFYIAAVQSMQSIRRDS